MITDLSSQLSRPIHRPLACPIGFLLGLLAGGLNATTIVLGLSSSFGNVSLSLHFGLSRPLLSESCRLLLLLMYVNRARDTGRERCESL